MKTKIRHFSIYLFTSLLLSILLSVVYIFTPKSIDSLDNALRDYMFLYRGTVDANDNVVIVDIDNKSLSQIGQWPWSRDVFSKLLLRLSDADVGIIGLDVVFAEADRTSPHLLANKFDLDASQLPNYDEVLARTVATTPVILGYQFELEEENVVDKTFPNSQAVIIQKGLNEQNDRIIKGYGTINNIPLVANSAYSSGFFNNTPDESGIIRSVPLVISYEGMLYPSLALEIVRLIQNQQKIYVQYGVIGAEKVTVGDIGIPTDMFGRALINYRGGKKSYQYISAVDILNDDFSKVDIEGKIVLIGTSAAGLLDLRATPYESVFPGVEVHANMIDNILKGDFIYKPEWADGVNIFHIFILVFCVVFAIAYLPPLYVPFALGALVVADLYFLYVMLFDSGTVLNILMPLVAILSAGLTIVIVNNFFVQNSAKVIKKKFASKVSAAVMEDILSNEDDILSGKDREITVFFSDLRNFTNISEALHDPKLLIQFLNEYMTPMSEIIVKNGGTIDKYIGDAIMAYFNAPAQVDNHQDKAVISALEQLYAVKKLNQNVATDPRFHLLVESFEKKGIANYVDIGIGLNSGVAVVGEMGSSGRSDYTVVGDPVNLGSRLESLCKYYNSKLNISHFTKQALQGKYIYRFLDLVTVKGKSEPVEIWQIIDYDRQSDEKLYGVSKSELFDELESYHRAINLYKTMHFSQALEIFQMLEASEKKTNLNIYNIYIQRCKHYIKEPPKDFNGVFTHMTKG